MELALRPMSTSQVLDRTFYLYRNNFVLFAGIAIITPALKLIALLVQLKIFGPITVPQQPDDFTPHFMQTFFVRVIIGAIISSIVYLIGTALASSATAYAVSMVHLGKATTIGESYSKIKPIFLKIIWLLFRILIFTIGPLLLCYVLLLGSVFTMASLTKAGGGTSPVAAMIIGIAAALLGLAGLVGSLVWMFYALCRYALAVPACTLENLSAKNSMVRSKFLTYGAKWSILGIVLLTAVMSFVVGYALQLPALLATGSMMLTAKTHLTMATSIWIYVADFLGGSITGPITTVALVLVYYDQRVRKEAFDLQIMMEAVGQQAQMQPAVAAPPPPAFG
ncbi:MAG TPA: glycerophosphoryl diester phosphodiesterase membrane domain-containing protein [Candidatus Angelobacter sp.]|jgi:hypothetical protein